MKKIILFVLYIICNNTFAQIVSLNSANKALNDLKYMDAIAQYQQLLSSKSAEQKKILFPDQRLQVQQPY